MGTNHYLVNLKTKEYMHFGTGARIVATAFRELIANNISINNIKDFIKDKNHWAKEISEPYIEIIANKFYEIAEKAKDDLMLCRDECYEKFNGEYGIITDIGIGSLNCYEYLFDTYEHIPESIKPNPVIPIILPN